MKLHSDLDHPKSKIFLIDMLTRSIYTRISCVYILLPNDVKNNRHRKIWNYNLSKTQFLICFLRVILTLIHRPFTDGNVSTERLS